MRNTKSTTRETWSSERVKELTMRKINESRANAYSLTTPRRMRRGFAFAVIAAVLALTSVGGVLAAQYFLKPSEVVSGLGDALLGAAFESDSAVNINRSVTSGGYTFTLLAVVSGDDISDMPYYKNGELARDRTYGVIAVQNADGSPMTAEAQPVFLATPLVKGEKPWEVNAVTLGGGYSEAIVDGVLYRVVECDNVMKYADKGLYFAVCTDMFISNATFSFNEVTGEISVNPNYGGASAVFDLPIDKPIVSADSAAQDLSGASAPENTAIDPPLAPDMRSIDWLNATPVESTIKVLTATADGEIIFTFDFYGGGGTVSALFDDCFKDDVKAAIVHISTTTDAEGNDSSYAIRFSLDENGVITGAVVTVE